MRSHSSRSWRWVPSLWLGIFAWLAFGCANSLRPAEAGPEEDVAAEQEVVRPLDPQGRARGQLWRTEVLYLVLPDRFFNGDTTNDRLGVPDCFDPSKPKKYHGGDLEGLRRKLDYLSDLGVTTVWSTPVYAQVPEGEACGYHGYWADFTFPDDGAVEPKLGTSSDLTRLIDDLHSRGMRFMFDMVVNHSGDLARIPKQKPSWFHNPSGCEKLGPPKIFCPMDGHPDFAQENPEVADYLDGVSAGWVSRFAADGIRMDTAKHVSPSYFKDRWIPAVRANNPNRFLLGEVFDEGSLQSLTPYLEAGFDGMFNFPLRRGLVDAFAHGGSVDGPALRVRETIHALGMERALQMVNMIDNHDAPRFANEPGLGVSEDEIRRRHHLALTALFTVPGIPQLYYGDELALYGAGDPDNRRDMPAWAFSASTRAGDHPGSAPPDAEKTFSLTRKLIQLRKSVPALSAGDYVELWRHGGSTGPNVWAYLRNKAESHAVIALNNGTAATGVMQMDLCHNPEVTPESCGGDGLVWEEQLGDTPRQVITASGGRIPLTLEPKTAAVFLPRKTGVEVVFEVVAQTAWGERLAIKGPAAELGANTDARALHLKPTQCQGARCTWAASLRYLHGSTPLAFEVVRVRGGQVSTAHPLRTTMLPATGKVVLRVD